MSPDQIAHSVHIVYNYAYQSKQADEKADNNCGQWWENG